METTETYIFKKTKYNPFKDISFWTLLMANIYTIFIYFKNNLSIGEFSLIFWFQSFVIGIITFITIIKTDSSLVKNLTLKGGGELTGNTAKVSVAMFFFFHYGIFQFVHLIFIFVSFGYTLRSESFPVIVSAATAFLFSHVISFVRKKMFVEKNNKLHKKINLISITNAPYARIIPMHAVLIIGGMYFSDNLNIFIFFIFLKIIIDLGAHFLKQYFILKD